MRKNQRKGKQLFHVNSYIYISLSSKMGACTLFVSLVPMETNHKRKLYPLSRSRTKYHDNIWGMDHRVHLQKKNTIMTVKIMPAYLIHWSTRCRLSISFSTELERPTVFRTSSAFRCALWKQDKGFKKVFFLRPYSTRYLTSISSNKHVDNSP